MKFRSLWLWLWHVRLPPHGGSGLKSIHSRLAPHLFASPSTRREWIEIPSLLLSSDFIAASPSTRREWIEICTCEWFVRLAASPSTRREWIEISARAISALALRRLPPHGGSGLKSQELVAHKLLRCLPPHGGSGLKCTYAETNPCKQSSPSTRREWIEIFTPARRMER